MDEHGMKGIDEISADSFHDEVKKLEKPIVIEFWIKTCGYCQKFKPIYEKLPAIFGGKVKFLVMNMFLNLENLKLAEGLGVEDTPTLKIFCRGKEVGEVIGYRPLDKVVDEIREILETKEC